MHITFTAKTSILDLFLKTVHRGHASESNRRPCKIFLASHFSTSSEQKFLKKGSLTKTCRESVTQLALLLALLASASASSSIRRGLGRRLVWASFWRGACTRTPGYCSWSVQARRLNSPATRDLEVLGGINCRQ
jgi:hypothetical protein